MLYPHYSVVFPIIALVSIVLTGCYSRTPAVGDIEINGDLPLVEKVLMPIGVTLNNTGATGRDLLSDNLVLNGSFDLAHVPELCAYNTDQRTITTPNGYTCFYPAPAILHGWEKSSNSVQYQGADVEHSGHITFCPSLSDTVPCSIRQSVYTLPVRSGETYSLSFELSGNGGGIEAFLMSGDAQAVSSVFRASPREGWRKVTGHLTVEEDADSAYLVIQALAPTITDDVSLVPQRSPHTILSVDNVRLTGSVSVPDQLRSILSRLSPGFIRFPSGRTANGYYPGTYPVWWRDSVEQLAPEQWPLWTLEQGEMTGDFGIDQFMALAHQLRSIPILVDNSGFTDQKAMQRTEDIALLPKRIERLFGVVNSHGHDSLILQLGYGITGSEYERRFTVIAQEAKARNLKASLTAAGSLIQNDRKFNDHVVDYQIPVVTSPDLRHYIPHIYHQPEQSPEPIMLGEVHFDAESDPTSYHPLFILKAATLIDAERNSQMIRGISITPFLSENPSDVPMIYVRGAEYKPTTFFDFIRVFTSWRGKHLRHIPHEHIGDTGLIYSLTSDERGDYYYLKAANTTRHPLTYRLKVRGNKMGHRHADIVRFHPTASTTTEDMCLFVQYDMTEDQLTLSMHGNAEVTIAPFEVLILRLSH